MDLATQHAALLDRVPVLRGPREVAALPGGLTNTNLVVTCAAGRFVVRIGGGNAAALGIDRDAEHANSRIAADAGVGAPVVAYLPEDEVLVVGFLEGRTLCNADLADADVVRRVARSVRRLHAAPAFQGEFDMFARQRGYLATVTERGYRLPAGYRDHADTFARIERALAVRAEPLVSCNNDLLAGNLVDDGETVRLIDYEYAGTNDACFELGNLAGECALDRDALEVLISEYSGGHRPDRVARALLQCAVGQYGWTLWGVIQASVSPLDFDFWSWGLERYEKAVALFADPALDTLLDEATR